MTAQPFIIYHLSINFVDISHDSANQASLLALAAPNVII